MRREFWWTLVVLGAGGLYMGSRVLGAYWDYPAAAGELPQAVRDYRAAGLPWTAADLERHVPDAQNAASLVQRAMGAMPGREADAAFDQEAKTRVPDPAPYARALDFAHEAARLPLLDFHRDWDQVPELVPETASIRRFAKALAARSERSATRGDDDGALRDLNDARRLGALLGQEPSVTAALSAVATERLATLGAIACLARVADAPARLARYREWLAKPPVLPDFVRALRGEMYLSLALGRNAERFGMGRGFWPGSDFDHLKDSAEAWGGLRRDGLPTSIRARAYMARGLQQWVELVCATDGFSGSVEGIVEASRTISDRTAESKALSHEYDALLFPNIENLERTPRLARTQRAVGLAYANALILHARTGRWPTRVALADPYGTGPLRCRFDGKRFRVWSVGRDGKDDGGFPAREAYALGRESDDEVAAFPSIPRKILTTAPPLSYGYD